MSDLFEERKKRLAKLNRALKKLFPDASIALVYGNTWELLVAVILSAQCTDLMVNKVTKNLFQKYPTLDAYVEADLQVFEQAIHSTGFYHNKAKNILASAKIVRERFGGKVPEAMADLLTLPGVARKTANVVMGNAYGRVEGIAVDTHVIRFVTRFNLSDHTDPQKIERDLMALLPKKEWLAFTYRVIEYCRRIAPARRYDTSQDPLVAIYPPAGERFRV